jgi:hypothetical protein
LVRSFPSTFSVEMKLTYGEKNLLRQKSVNKCFPSFNKIDLKRCQYHRWTLGTFKLKQNLVNLSMICFNLNE